MLARLDQMMWQALSGDQRVLSVGGESARRFTPGLPAIAGFRDPQRPDLDALAPFCGVGEPFYVEGWDGPAPAGWQVQLEAEMVKMRWEGQTPLRDEAPEARRLGAADVPQMLALAALTKPGPIGARNLEMGDYFGLCDAAGQLIAMAGERMAAAPWREVSAVCTHPAHQGRGLARRLMLKLIGRQLARGERPCLHVMAGNSGARGLYGAMGFAEQRIVPVRVVARVP